MKKFVLIIMFFLLGISYSNNGISRAIENVLKLTNEEQRKELKEPLEIAEYKYYSAHDNLFNYKIISEKEFEERGVKYAIVDVEITGPVLDEFNRILTSEYFIKLGTLYKNKENWKAYQIGNEIEDDGNKYYKRQQELRQIVYKDFENILKKTKFVKEKKRFELYMVLDESYGYDEWIIFIPREESYALYDPKIEKYLENNIKFMDAYDFSSQATFF